MQKHENTTNAGEFTVERAELIDMGIFYEVSDYVF